METTDSTSIPKVHHYILQKKIKLQLMITFLMRCFTHLSGQKILLNNLILRTRNEVTVEDNFQSIEEAVIAVHYLIIVLSEKEVCSCKFIWWILSKYDHGVAIKFCSLSCQHNCLSAAQSTPSPAFLFLDHSSLMLHDHSYNFI